MLGAMALPLALPSGRPPHRGAWKLALVLMLAGACGRSPLPPGLDGLDDDSFDDGAENAGSPSDSSEAGDSLEAQGIRVFSEAYLGSIVHLDITIDPESNCGRFKPPPFECAPPEIWYVRMELLGQSARPGVWREPDLSGWTAEHTEEPPEFATCAYTGSVGDLMDAMVLTIDLIEPDGTVHGRVDDMGITVFEHPPISGSFRSITCN